MKKGIPKAIFKFPKTAFSKPVRRSRRTHRHWAYSVFSLPTDWLRYPWTSLLQFTTKSTGLFLWCSNPHEISTVDRKSSTRPWILEAVCIYRNLRRRTGDLAWPPDDGDTELPQCKAGWFEIENSNSCTILTCQVLWWFTGTRNVREMAPGREINSYYTLNGHFLLAAFLTKEKNKYDELDHSLIYTLLKR
jgi:hypothetical protein